jgi:hypothetical protein
VNLPSRQRRPPAPATDLRYTRHKSGGRKPPVANETSRGWCPPAPATGLRYTLRKSGGRKPPVVPINADVTAIHTRTHTVGGLPDNRARVYANVFPRPRRAHARRSFSACVCASKKPFFAGRHSHRNTRAGGVSSPWCVLGMRTCLRKSGALPLQTRFVHPRRANARRSWLPVR